MRGESVKGSLLLGAVVAAKRLRDRGRVSPEAFEARLSQQALEIVDQKIELARWYPIGPFCELIELAWEVEGSRRPQYLEAQGAASADRLFDSNRYQQLDFAERAEKVKSRMALEKQTRLIATITGTFYDFIEVSVELEPTQLSMVYSNARAFTDPLIHTTIGFLNQVNVRQGSERRWTGRRTRPDEVRFSMPLPTRLSESD